MSRLNDVIFLNTVGYKNNCIYFVDANSSSLYEFSTKSFCMGKKVELESKSVFWAVVNDEINLYCCALDSVCIFEIDNEFSIVNTYKLKNTKACDAFIVKNSIVFVPYALDGDFYYFDISTKTFIADENWKIARNNGRINGFRNWNRSENKVCFIGSSGDDVITYDVTAQVEKFAYTQTSYRLKDVVWFMDSLFAISEDGETLYYKFDGNNFIKTINHADGKDMLQRLIVTNHDLFIVSQREVYLLDGEQFIPTGLRFNTEISGSSFIRVLSEENYWIFLPWKYSAIGVVGFGLNHADMVKLRIPIHDVIKANPIIKEGDLSIEEYISGI